MDNDSVNLFDLFTQTTFDFLGDPVAIHNRNMTINCDMDFHLIKPAGCSDSKIVYIEDPFHISCAMPDTVQGIDFWSCVGEFTQAVP